MKQLFALFLASMMIFCSSCGATTPTVSYLSNPSRTNAMLNATAGLFEDEDEHLICSGVFISENEVLTAAHCLRHERHISLGIENGQLAIIVTPEVILDHINVVTYQQYYSNDEPLSVFSIFDVVARDNNRDLVLLRAHEPEYSTIHSILTPPSEHSQDNIVIGEETFVVGHPVGVPWNISHGFISSRIQRNEDGISIIISSTPIFFGNSGGPLIDGNLNLIGICSSMRGSSGAGVATHLGNYIAPSEIFHFLSEARR